MDQLIMFFRKYFFQLLIAFLGLVLFIYTFSGNQNLFFMIGSLAILVAGLLSSLMAFEVISGSTVYRILLFVLLPACGLIATLSYKSIDDPIKFEVVKKKRLVNVIEHLKDIRTAQIVYKSVNKHFTNSAADLVRFVNTDSIPVVKAIGNVPDTLTEEKAIELGLISRDTVRISVKDSIFKGKSYLVEDLIKVPYSNNEEFQFKAGEIEKGKVMVSVFEVFTQYRAFLHDMDTELFNPDQLIKVGSMTEPTNAGNWE